MVKVLVGLMVKVPVPLIVSVLPDANVKSTSIIGLPELIVMLSILIGTLPKLQLVIVFQLVDVVPVQILFVTIIV